MKNHLSLPLAPGFLNTLFWEKPYSKMEAYIDLIMMATKEPRDVELKNGEVLHLEAGELFRSYENLAERWGWNLKNNRPDRKRVSRFLNATQFATYFATRVESTKTVITILCYDQYCGNATGRATENCQELDRELKDTNVSKKELEELKHTPTRVREKPSKIKTKETKEIDDLLNGDQNGRSLAIFEMNEFLGGPDWKMAILRMFEIEEISQDDYMELVCDLVDILVAKEEESSKSRGFPCPRWEQVIGFWKYPTSKSVNQLMRVKSDLDKETSKEELQGQYADVVDAYKRSFSGNPKLPKDLTRISELQKYYEIIKKTGISCKDYFEWQSDKNDRSSSLSMVIAEWDIEEWWTEWIEHSVVYWFRNVESEIRSRCISGLVNYEEEMNRRVGTDWLELRNKSDHFSIVEFA